MELPECPNFRDNLCPKSDVKFMNEHGPPQGATHWTFFCKTCRYLFIKWNERLVELGKQGKLDPSLNSLANPRFRGLN